MTLRVHQLHVFQAFRPIGAGVALRQLNRGPLVSPLRNHHLNIGRNHLWLVRHQDQLGLAWEALAKFRQPQRHEFGVRLLEPLAQLQRETLNDRSVADVQHIDIAVFRIAQKRKHIH